MSAPSPNDPRPERTHDPGTASDDPRFLLAPVSLHALDGLGRITAINERGLAEFGHARAALLGRPETDFLTALSADAYRERVLPRLADGRPVETLALERRSADGTPHETLSAFTRLPGDAGWLVASWDARAVRGSEQALAASEQRMRLALDAAGLVLWEWDLASDMLEGLTFRGSALDTGDGRWRRSHAERQKLAHPDERARLDAVVREAIASGAGAYTTEFQLAPEQGADRWYEQRGQIVRDASGTAVRIHGVSFESTARHRAERALAEAYASLRDLSRKLDAAREEERRDMARRLHDELAQGLTAVALHLDLLLHPGPHDDESQRHEDVVGLLETQLDWVRRLSAELRPPLLDELGLSAAVENLVASQRRVAHAQIELASDGADRRTAPEIESAAYRIVHEAVLNAIRHADAKRISVSLQWDANELAVRIEDDGRGFDPSDVQRPGRAFAGQGLARMEKRATLPGGRFALESAPGRGTRVAAQFALESAP